MVKIVRLLSIWIFLIILAIKFTSCSNDGYSLDNYWKSIVTVNKIGDNVYDFTLDNGKRLWIASPAGATLNLKYKRAIINYTILSGKQGDYDHYIKLNGLSDVLTKDIIYIDEDDITSSDSIGHDPIRVYSIWEGGGFLNISFGFNLGGVNAHLLNLVSCKSDWSENDDVIELKFVHNQNNDPGYYPTKRYISFDLSPYKIKERDKVTFKVTWLDFDGEIKQYNLEYKYGSSSSNISYDENKNTYDTNLNIY